MISFELVIVLFVCLYFMTRCCWQQNKQKKSKVYLIRKNQTNKQTLNKKKTSFIEFINMTQTYIKTDPKTSKNKNVF